MYMYVYIYIYIYIRMATELASYYLFISALRCTDKETLTRNKSAIVCELLLFNMFYFSQWTWTTSSAGGTTRGSRAYNGFRMFSSILK